MTAIDANLLLYAYNADAPQQGPVARTLAIGTAREQRSGRTAVDHYLGIRPH
jgi:hypothetical protein